MGDCSHILFGSPATIPTQLALTFFGILHVPINGECHQKVALGFSAGNNDMHSHCVTVPALAVSTRQEVDVNREIIGHGISNLASGLIGSCQVCAEELTVITCIALTLENCFFSKQNYLVYSNSVLYIRSGGGSRLGGILLAIATALIWMAGGKVVGFVPTIVVGSYV